MHGPRERGSNKQLMSQRGQEARFGNWGSSAKTTEGAEVGTRAEMERSNLDFLSLENNFDIPIQCPHHVAIRLSMASQTSVTAAILFVRVDLRKRSGKPGFNARKCRPSAKPDALNKPAACDHFQRR